MQKRILIAPLCVLFLAGCQTLGKPLKNEHVQEHAVAVQATGRNVRFAKNLNVVHRLKEGGINLVLFGDIERSMGALVSGVKVKARFTDQKGQIINEEGKFVYFQSRGSRMNREYKGSFYIEVPESESIVTCEVEFM